MPEISEITTETRIQSLGAKGDGLSGALAVPFSLPEDLIKDGQIKQASPHRITPACKHFKECGGCSLQHASDPFLADWKQGIVAQALRSQELPSDIRAIHVSPPHSRRRAVFSGRRTKKTVQLGFFARRSDQLVLLEECPILVPKIMDSLEVLKTVTRLAATRTSTVKLTVTEASSGLDLSVSGARDISAEQIGALAKTTPGISRISWNAEVILLKTAPLQTFGPAQVVPPPGAFLQATKEGETALIGLVLEGLGETSRVVDLFAGCGTFTLPISEIAEVHGVEFEPDMVAALDKAWRSETGLKRLSVEARDLFRRPLLRSEFKGFDAVVLDPPRAGAEAQVAEIVASDVARVVHVSCNPQTFAREAKTLQNAGFRLDWVDVVDQFRWSSHVEVVGCFSR